MAGADVSKQGIAGQAIDKEKEKNIQDYAFRHQFEGSQVLYRAAQQSLIHMIVQYEEAEEMLTSCTVVLVSFPALPFQACEQSPSCDTKVVHQMWILIVERMSLWQRLIPISAGKSSKNGCLPCCVLKSVIQPFSTEKSFAASITS